ncbi:hypothetical protein MFLAVUS_003280 [Mucor flavus]|uniref:Uncharacterized protein n=1 Tax=Mucor flavus TaxID=439312 RepID=A0ABP9YSM8_9FUNG
MKKAGSIEETSISFHKEDQYQGPVDNFETTIFFKLLNEFRRTQQTYCEASFLGCYHDSDRSTSCSFSYTDNGKLFVGYDKCDSFFPPPNLPDKTSSVIGPEIFNALQFVILDVSGDRVLLSLDYYLSNCPELQSFHNGYSEDPLYDPFIFSLHCKDLISSDTTNRNINYLKIAFIDPVQSYFDLVTAHLHDIEVVSLEPSEWDITYHDSVLDLTGFKKLKTFKYIATIHESEKKDNDFILPRYTNGEEQYYYLDKEKSRNLQVDSCQNPNTPRLTVYCDASVAFDFVKSEVYYLQ